MFEAFFISVAGAYQLLMHRVRLFYVYGSQLDIDVKDFRNAEPNILSLYSSEIPRNFNKNYEHALKTLWKKKGLDIEGACFIGIDRLCTDVRVFKMEKMDKCKSSTFGLSTEDSDFSSSGTQLSPVETARTVVEYAFIGIQDDISGMFPDDGYDYDDNSLKAPDKDLEKKINSNGVSISGYFKRSDEALYQLEMQKVRLCTVYGYKFNIEVEDFTNAKPDILAGYSSKILETFNNKKCTDALKTLYKKRDLYIEEACFIGVDRLGTDVRVFKGEEVKTHRFPFKAQVKSVFEAKNRFNNFCIHDLC